MGARLGRRGHERRLDAAPRRPPLWGPEAGAAAAPVLAPRATAITATQGRWSLTAGCSQGAPDPRALAELLLERQGIVTRDGVRAEGIPGGYSAVYGELKALETLGLCRRGYFVEGLGGAQFALGGAVERIRELRPREDEPAVDGSVLAAATRPSRTARRLPGRSERGPERRGSPAPTSS